MFKDHAGRRFLKAQGYAATTSSASWFGPTRVDPDRGRESRARRPRASSSRCSRRPRSCPPSTACSAARDARGSRSATTPPRGGRCSSSGSSSGLPRRRDRKFVFAHILLPHDPYVFDADGSLVSEAEAEATPEARRCTRDQLAVRQRPDQGTIVGYLLAEPEATRPIVIIEGDEGPLLCRSVDCVKNTPRLPADPPRQPRARCTCPAVDRAAAGRRTARSTRSGPSFRTYFGADLPPLPDRSYTWPDNDHIYDFQDVTDKITGPCP